MYELPFKVAVVICPKKVGTKFGAFESPLVKFVLVETIVNVNVLVNPGRPVITNVWFPILLKDVLEVNASPFIVAVPPLNTGVTAVV